MDRRSFLLGTSTLAISQLLAGCNNQPQPTLRVQMLKGSIPIQVLNKFRANLKQSAQINLASVPQLEELFTQLQSWKKQETSKKEKQPNFTLPLINTPPSTPPDLVTLGDYWLAAAIEQQLIQPLDLAKLQWQQLPKKWQELVTRNDQVWGAPYRFGSTVIVYNRDKFKSLKWTPTNWDDLWREELHQRISLLNHPREVIGLTLKKLGASYNTKNPKQVANLQAELKALDQQVKFYSSTNYLQPLIIGDTWLAVGWSSDVLPVLSRYQELAAVIPQSGTAIWADLWVRPKGNDSSASLGENWINFCWQPQIAEQISILSKATSPIPLTLKPEDIQNRLQTILLFDPQILDRSEFFLPLNQATTQEYQSLWQSMRQNNS